MQTTLPTIQEEGFVHVEPEMPPMVSMMQLVAEVPVTSPDSGARSGDPADDVVSNKSRGIAASHAVHHDTFPSNSVSSVTQLDDTVKLLVTRQFGEDSTLLVSKSPGVPEGIADYLGPVSVAVDVEIAPLNSRPSVNYHVYRPYRYTP